MNDELMEAQPLSARTLKYWSDRLPVPAYDRDQGAALDWGICGVEVLPEDLGTKQALDAQDGLYTLILKHSERKPWEPRMIGSIVQYLSAPDDPEAVIEKMAAASTRIVSLTITEGGYNISDITGEFDAANPDVVRDLEQGAVPRTTSGLVTEALNRRKKRGLDLFTVMSCDNLQGNGHLARSPAIAAMSAGFSGPIFSCVPRWRNGRP